MRIASVLFIGSVAALLATAPALAKDSTPQKTDDKSTSSSCHAYQQAADGSWTQLPCQESGNGSGNSQAGSQTQHKAVARGNEEEPR